ncbi:hypothetical protein FAI40_03680 [Acetobacteraceae bacterium]|nr:hypothetical protein FAI40_03680 [Acetobacteraceae bacterium]
MHYLLLPALILAPTPVVYPQNPIMVPTAQACDRVRVEINRQASNIGNYKIKSASCVQLADGDPIAPSGTPQTNPLPYGENQTAGE